MFPPQHIEVPMPVPNGFRVVEYAPEHLDGLVLMWRASFERGVGVIDFHPIEEQKAYFENIVLPNNRVVVVLEKASDNVVGFLAANDDTIAQLYIHVDFQGKGIGSALLNRAKEESGGMLRLFTFESNTKAQRFYQQHGFRIIARGFEEEWQMEDIEYQWIEEVG